MDLSGSCRASGPAHLSTLCASMSRTVGVCFADPSELRILDGGVAEVALNGVQQCAHLGVVYFRYDLEGRVNGDELPG